MNLKQLLKNLKAYTKISINFRILVYAYRNENVSEIFNYTDKAAEYDFKIKCVNGFWFDLSKTNLYGKKDIINIEKVIEIIKDAYTEHKKISIEMAGGKLGYREFIPKNINVMKSIFYEILNSSGIKDKIKHASIATELQCI